MILLTHIAIASLSLVLTGFLLVSPSKTKLYASYVLVILTLFTGFYLVLARPASLTRTCITGLIYLGFVSIGIVIARQKLLHSK